MSGGTRANTVRPQARGMRAACDRAAPRRPASLALSLVLVGMTALVPPALAQDRAAIERGQAKFDYLCAPCHGAGIGDDGRAMLPGTDALRIKYRGELPALLEERTDLTPEALRVFVRRGVFSMPPFRPTEITDAEIDEIAAYLADAAAN
jgi:mono/diheme cytochrome c family protein